MIRALQPRTLSQLQIQIYSSIRSWQSLATTSFRTRDLGFSRLVLLKIHTQCSSLTRQWRKWRCSASSTSVISRWCILTREQPTCFLSTRLPTKAGSKSSIAAAFLLQLATWRYIRNLAVGRRKARYDYAVLVVFCIEYKGKLPKQMKNDLDYWTHAQKDPEEFVTRRCISDDPICFRTTESNIGMRHHLDNLPTWRIII